MPQSLNAPVGGTLINRLIPPADEPRIHADLSRASAIRVSEFEITDLFQIALGGYSPLQGFFNEADYLSVIERGYLANGTTPWSVPVTLSVDEATAKSLIIGSAVALTDATGKRLGRIVVSTIYRRRVPQESIGVFRTQDAAHPGVARITNAGQWLIGGPVDVFSSVLPDHFFGLEYRPAAIRAEFERRGWRKVVAFQTRNPIHRAHEYLLKTALENADGLLIHPLVGETKGDDIPADVRVKCYTTLVREYFPKDRVVLAALPVAMRYAGPKEAIHHALIRKNYGASDFIVGRDHAGVGNYYGTYDAQQIFDTYPDGALGIRTINFENAFYDKKSQAMVTSKTTASDPSFHVSISGTKLREILASGQYPPVEVVRPEIADILIAHYRDQAAAQRAALNGTQLVAAR